MRIGSLCSGYGGLTLAVQQALGGDVAWHSENEEAPSAVLATRFPDVPNLGDMTKIDWATVEPVDVYEGGTPCQDVSGAGGRAGMREGNRSGLWASFALGVSVLRPRLVIWENVRGVTYAEADSDVEPCPICMGDGTGDALRALGRVLGDLADVGYDAEWVGFPASDVGAPHPRFRVFLIAYPGGGGWHARWAALGRDRAQADAARRGAAVADTDSAGSEGAQPAGGRLMSDRRPASHTDRNTVREQPVAVAGSRSAAVARQAGDLVSHAQGERRRERRPDRDGFSRGQERDGEPETGREVQQRHDTDGRAVVDWGRYRGAVERWELILGRRAPEPARANRNGSPKLTPEFDEWLMGLPAGWVSGVPGISWNDMLKICGNGVVPQQAAAALRHLLGIEQVLTSVVV